MAELRPYQNTAVESIENEWGADHARTLLVMATGTGKTIVMAEVAKRETERGGRTLLLAHREELLTQAAEKFTAYSGLLCDLEKAENHAGFLAPIVVGSVQSMCRKSRLDRYDPNDFSLVMVDEAHHSVSGTYQAVLEHFSDARVLGVTATPDRSDRKGLAETFDSIAFEYGMLDAVRDGYLVPIVARQMPVEIDMHGVRMQSGDYAASDVGDRLEPMLPAIARAMIDAGCKDRKSVAFLPLIDTAKKFKAACESVGLRAAEVNGQSEDRAEILADFDAGKYDVLCNAMLLTEGWDCPSVDCIVPLRATKSRALFQQIVGRGTRLCPETGKQNLLLLDFLWMTDRHNLCKPASLVSSSEEIELKIEDYLAAGYEMDLVEAEVHARKDVIAEREASLARELAAQRKRKARTVDPLQYAMSIEAVDLATYEPQFDWEKQEPTERQLQTLEKAGIDPSGIWCRGIAALIFDKLNARSKANLATPRQIRKLEQYGFMHVGRWTFEEAHSMMGRISLNGWRIPFDIQPQTYLPPSIKGLEV